MGNPAGGIVLILDGYANAAAMEWAARAAARSRQPLRICGQGRALSATETWLRENFPQLPTVVDDPPDRTAPPDRDPILAVGRGEVLDHLGLRCPVVLIGPPVRPERPVVAVMEFPDLRDAQIELAFRLAYWQESAVRMMLAYRRPPHGTWIGLPPGFDASLREQVTAEGQARLNRWNEKFPEVRASLAVRPGSLRSCAVHAARNGSLIVLHPDLSTVYSSDVGREILATGHCSVALSEPIGCSSKGGG
ncbi:MAG TPA: hypothetical protein VHC49_08115 [Mycobacteriales bacterium]|nr:hypothetical protein [Mycobacteriales bacterium]